MSEFDYNPEYKYRAKIIDVYDGDTVTAIIDLGLGVHKVEKLRLSRINAPEVRGDSRPDGLNSKEFLIELLRHECNDNQVMLWTIKDKKGKFGRYIAEIFTNHGTNVSDCLVEHGLAVYREY